MIIWIKQHHPSTLLLQIQFDRLVHLCQNIYKMENHILAIKKYSIIFIVALCIYLWLLLFFPKQQIFYKDRLIEKTPRSTILSWSMLTWYDDISDMLFVHPSAWINRNDKYVQLCLNMSILCQKISFQGDFDDKTRFIYTNLLAYWIWKIESYWLTNLDETIDSIRIENGGKRRWYATHNSIVLAPPRGQSNSEFFQVAIHELWHIIDLWIIQWASTILNEEFTEFWDASFSIDDRSVLFYALSRQWETTKKPWSSYKDYVSWYAMTNPFEDFAETMNMYLNNRTLFENMSRESDILRQKFNFMDWLYKESLFPALNRIAYTSLRRPRDSTRMR